MAIFNSYVKLPEGISSQTHQPSAAEDPTETGEAQKTPRSRPGMMSSWKSPVDY